nr:ABC transporter ATP-binding protein [Kofleriaceae bacterium]
MSAAAATEPVVEIASASKWYGPVIGCSDVSWTLRGGIVGLLGPNGAGKSTLIKMMAGLHRPNRGSVRVFGADPYDDVAVRARIGYAPEHEKSWDDLTGLEVTTAMARLAGVPANKAEAAAKDALAVMGMTDAMKRNVRGYSKGMRQRTKLATAMAHDPDFLLLDEPLTGVDPMARADILARIEALAKAGKTVLISSHVLYEVEALTEEILVIYRGQVLAEGNVFEIRRLIDKRPHRIRLDCEKPREVAKLMAGADHVVHLGLDATGVMIETTDPDRCYDELAATIVEHGVAVSQLTSPDNNLSAVFDYLTTGRGADS